MTLTFAGTMRAAVCTRYGGPDVIELRELPRPHPGKGEVIVRVRAASVSVADRRIRSQDMPSGFGLPARLAFGIRRPRCPVLGACLSGEIESVGESVRGWQSGDEVVAMTGMAMGAHAEACRVRADRLVSKPSGLSHQTAAAALFGGTVAFDFLARAALGAGDTLLVVGAAGVVGSAAIARAAHLGVHASAVCRPEQYARLFEQGAHVCHDRAGDWPPAGQRYDAVLDASGALHWRQLRDWLKPGGRFLMLAGGLVETLTAPFDARLRGQRVIAGPAPESPSLVEAVMAAAAAGHWRPMIDSVYDLADICEAHAHRTGRCGCVLVVP